MTNEEQLAILKEGPNAWNEWRLQQLDNFSANLHNTDLRGANLHGVNLRSANLSFARLHGANLSDTDLRGADLRSANLAGADLGIANLRGANLSNTILHGANFSVAELGRADLNDAELNNADLRVANLTGANLAGADLRGANLAGADLSRAILDGVTLAETVIANSILTDAIGLEEVKHFRPSILDHRTIERSGKLPDIFLRGCGWPDSLIDYIPSLINQAISFYSCFISYSHEDKTFARRLHDQLQGQGIRCWLDDHQILPGDDIYQQIDQGIKLWDKVLLCASKNSLTSWWVDNEISTAFKKEQQLMRERKERVLSLIPLNLDGYIFSDEWSNGKSSPAKERMVADFTDWAKDNDKFEQAFEKVVKALKTDDAGREEPPKSKL